MTLCTGALCNLGNTKAVVAFDTMASTTIAQAENAFKFEKLGKRWIALIAGRISDARELAGVYRERGRADFRGSAAKQRSVIHLYHAAFRNATAVFGARFSSTVLCTCARSV